MGDLSLWSWNCVSKNLTLSLLAFNLLVNSCFAAKSKLKQITSVNQSLVVLVVLVVLEEPWSLLDCCCWAEEELLLGDSLVSVVGLGWEWDDSKPALVIVGSIVFLNSMMLFNFSHKLPHRFILKTVFVFIHWFDQWFKQNRLVQT